MTIHSFCIRPSRLSWLDRLPSLVHLGPMTSGRVDASALCEPSLTLSGAGKISVDSYSAFQIVCQLVSPLGTCIRDAAGPSRCLQMKHKTGLIRSVATSESLPDLTSLSAASFTLGTAVTPIRHSRTSHHLARRVCINTELRATRRQCSMWSMQSVEEDLYSLVVC